MKSRLEKIVKAILKEDKFTLHYILKALDHKNWFYTYVESYSKTELRDALIRIADTNLDKFKELESYKIFFNESRMEISFYDFRNKCYYVGTSEDISEYYKTKDISKLNKYNRYIDALYYAGLINQ